MVFRKNLRSLERRWEKISKFLGDLPSEQIFYRNIPLGAPVHYRVMEQAGSLESTKEAS